MAVLDDASVVLKHFAQAFLPCTWSHSKLGIPTDPYSDLGHEEIIFTDE